MAQTNARLRYLKDGEKNNIVLYDDLKDAEAMTDYMEVMVSGGKMYAALEDLPSGGMSWRTWDDTPGSVGLATDLKIIKNGEKMIFFRYPGCSVGKFWEDEFDDEFIDWRWREGVADVSYHAESNGNFRLTMPANNTVGPWQIICNQAMDFDVYLKFDPSSTPSTLPAGGDLQIGITFFIDVETGANAIAYMDWYAWQVGHGLESTIDGVAGSDLPQGDPNTHVWFRIKCAHVSGDTYQITFYYQRGNGETPGSWTQKQQRNITLTGDSYGQVRFWAWRDSAAGTSWTIPFAFFRNT